jgi:hypothetical protein
VMAFAVAGAGMAGQRRPTDRLAAGCTRRRGGVDQPQLVTPAWGMGGEVLDGQGGQRPSPAQPPVVGRGRWQVREQMAQPLAGEAQPAALGAEPEQDLGDGQQTSSASLSLGLRPGPRRGPSSSSMVTYSAMTRVSRSARTRPPRRSTLLQQRRSSAPSSQLSPLDTHKPIRKQPSSGHLEE